MLYNFKYIILFCGAVFFIGCASALYTPAPEHATATATYDELVEGRRIYVSKCGSCHRLYTPTQYDHHTWKENIDEMQERSEINEQQKELIYKYLTNAPVVSSK